MRYSRKKPCDSTWPSLDFDDRRALKEKNEKKSILDHARWKYFENKHFW